MPYTDTLAKGHIIDAVAERLIAILTDVDDFARIITNHHQFELDLRKIDKEDIEQAKTFLKKMKFDNCFEMRIVK
jgi:hypothetical protein